jgi:hypothetical protein
LINNDNRIGNALNWSVCIRWQYPIEKTIGSEPLRISHRDEAERHGDWLEMADMMVQPMFKLSVQAGRGEFGF